MHTPHLSVALKVPPDIEPKLERQIREYAHLREIGEQFGKSGLLDPTHLC